MNNTRDERIKRLMYLMEYDNRKTDKKILKETVETLYESKQTEQQALAILRKSNGKDDASNQQIVNRLRASDTSKNQVLIPIMAKMYTETGEAGLRELQQLFMVVSEMVNSNKIGVPVISDAGYTVNNKTFANYLKFAEFIHGLEGMSKGHAEWKGKMGDIETDEPPIWEGAGIKIYDGNDVGKCIKYTTGGLTGKHYGFCIGQPANTMWQSYRDTKTSTFH